MASESRVNNISESLNSLLAKQDLLLERKTELLMEIKEHETFLESKDEVRDFLAGLYNRSQSSTKAVYEGLLTNLVNEVMPGNDEAHSVRFNSSIKNNKTALNIECVTKDGNVRDIYKDKGGTIESVIALGLRFIALSKTKNRRIILLDEPDAWIKTGPKYIPKLAGLLPQLAREIGMQVIYISHHDPKHFESHARIIQLTNDDGVHAETIDDDIQPSDMESADGIGWRFIRLTNVKQHENTLIELSPYVNMLIGDGDIGKTSIIDAVESLINNAGRESLIRDGMPYCRVEIGIEDGMVIEWTYHRKAKRKTLYQLIDKNGSVVQKSDSSEEVPAWLHEYLAMEPHHGFDLHIGDAHNVSFILDKSVSAHKRAEILSWGGDTRQIQMMMRMHSDESKTRTGALNACKAEINKVKSRLEVLRSVERAAVAFREYQDHINNGQALKARNEALNNQIEEISTLESKIACLAPIEKIATLSVAEDLAMTSQSELGTLLQRMEFLTQSINVLEDVPEPVSLQYEIGLVNSSEIREAGRSIAELQKKLDILNSIPELMNLNLPSNSESKALSDFGSGISELSKKIKQTQKELDSAENEMKQIQEDKKQIIVDNEGRCILCHSTFEHTHKTEKDRQHA